MRTNLARFVQNLLYRAFRAIAPFRANVRHNRSIDDRPKYRTDGKITLFEEITTAEALKAKVLADKQARSNPSMVALFSSSCSYYSQFNYFACRYS